MKNIKKNIKKSLAVIITVIAVVTAISVPAQAGDQVETYQSPYGITYTVNYTRGSADIAGKHIYFGFTPDSTYVKIGGWRWACATKADELATMAVLDKAWFDWATMYCPTTEEYYRWKNAA